MPQDFLSLVIFRWLYRYLHPRLSVSTLSVPEQVRYSRDGASDLRRTSIVPHDRQDRQNGGSIEKKVDGPWPCPAGTYLGDASRKEGRVCKAARWTGLFKSGGQLDIAPLANEGRTWSQLQR
jgi:hypothetical protein